MRFSSETERSQHPQAGLIPLKIWREVFSDNILSEFEFELMQEPEESLLSYLNNKVNPAILLDSEKSRLWFAIACSHPALDYEKLIEIADRLEIKSDPDAVFNITDANEAKLYFYMIRHLIRRNDPGLLDNIRFLLDIPAVKSLAHTEVEPRQSNQLLRLALSMGNQEAAALLMTIPAVRDLAAQNNYYRQEQRGGLNLAQLAQDRESSLTALTSGERKRLDAAIKCYQPLLQNAGVDNVLTALREELKARYEQNPATIEVDGNKVELPTSWQAFQDLHLDTDDEEKALKSYYQNKDHSALRYLSKPNKWMSPNAAYVNISEDRTERWSTFEEYKPLITMLYLAAQDKEIAPVEAYTLETRLEHFIDELALIGRAHNWDKSRIKIDSQGEVMKDKEENVITEEYDDLEGDKPTCFSGVKRRLFQSVQGHPLLMMLTKEHIEQELKEFIREHFESCFRAGVSRQEIKAAWETCMVELNDTAETTIDTLKKLDIPAGKKNSLLDI